MTIKMHLKSFFALAILLATAAAVDILPLASSFDDYVPPASIEIAGLTLETHHLRPNPNDMQEWNDYAFVINERDRNQDILRQSLCEVSEVAGMTDEGDETICYYSPGLEETLGSLSAEDVEDIQMEYQGIIEDFPEMPSSDGDFEDQEREEDMMSLLRQTVTLRFGPVTGKFDFVVNIVGEDGYVLL